MSFKEVRYLNRQRKNRPKKKERVEGSVFELKKKNKNKEKNEVEMKEKRK